MRRLARLEDSKKHKAAAQKETLAEVCLFSGLYALSISLVG